MDNKYPVLWTNKNKAARVVNKSFLKERQYSINMYYYQPLDAGDARTNTAKVIKRWVEVNRKLAIGLQRCCKTGIK